MCRTASTDAFPPELVEAVKKLKWVTAMAEVTPALIKMLRR